MQCAQGLLPEALGLQRATLRGTRAARESERERVSFLEPKVVVGVQVMGCLRVSVAPPMAAEGGRSGTWHISMAVSELKTSSVRPDCVCGILQVDLR